jgi:2-C-methyl-D-erythritol 4-phosphate cytidylyltransferase/2-C-methyl-D-erythritol 2,4-cyclodiphosphate synthase
MGGGLRKQYRLLGDLPVVSRTLTIFEKEPAVGSVVLVVPPGEEDYCRNELVGPAGCRKVVAVVAGGEHRQDSVWAGLQCLPGPPDIVVVHDAVRPLVNPETVKEAINAAVSYGAVVVGVPAKDTVKTVNALGMVVETLPRDRLYLAQTPQVFSFDIIFEAHREARVEGFYGSDDAVLVERRGLPVRMVHGGYDNIKITTPEDFMVAAALTGENTLLRVGHGYDVHRLVADRPLVLGGMTIPWEKGLDGHSDADVLCHALMDALLGAAGAGDIGRHFPPTDEAFRGISSLTLLAEVRKILETRGLGVVNADTVILAEKPQLAPYTGQMAANLAAVLGLSDSRINVKATTTEGLGYTGRAEGIAAYAVALLHRTSAGSEVSGRER